jgi:hypothetical protein
LHFRRALHGRVDVAQTFGGAPQTVDLIRRYALEAQGRPEIRLLAEEIVSDLVSKDYLSEIRAVYFFVLSHTRYANDPRTVELVKRPELVVREIVAGKTPSLDCDDLVTFLAALYLSLGRHVQIMTVAFNRVMFRGHLQYSHVLLQVQEPRTKQWIIVDPVAAEDTDQMMARVKAVKIWGVA